MVFALFAIFIGEQIKHTRNAALWQSKSIAIEFKQKVIESSNKLLDDAKLDFFTKSTTQHGFSGQTIKGLQQRVIRDDVIAAALVVDLKGEIHEVYPFHWYALNPPFLKNRSVISASEKSLRREEGLTAVFVQSELIKSVVDENDALNLEKVKTAPVTEELPYLKLSVPLIYKVNSFVEPIKQSGNLVYLIPLRNILYGVMQSDVVKDGPQRLEIRYRGKSIYSNFTDAGMWPYSADTVLYRFNDSNSDSDSNSNEEALVVRVYEPLVNHLSAAFKSLVIVLVMLSLVLVMLFVFSRKLKNKLNAPLKEIVNQCKKIASGNLNADLKLHRKIEFEYKEFQVIYDALSEMNSTISTQVESIKEAKKRAERSESIKSQFLANMSHEIRTPVNGIIGMLSLVEKTELNAEQERKIGLVKKSANSLVTLINDILDFSKIEASKMELEYIEFNLLEMLTSLAEILETKAREKNIALKLDVSGINVSTALGDEGRLRQVLLNIIANAIKFTEKGGVSITACYYVDSLNHGLFVCEVRDTGIGMDEKQLNTIFDNFVQADNSTTRRFGGSGLGLTISKKLTELMEGNIAVQSKIGEGSKFTIEIPMQPGEDAFSCNTSSQSTVYMEKKKSVSAVSNAQGKHILLVEDNEINQEVVSGLLEELEINVDIAGDGLQALNKLKLNNYYDLILMDVQMPTMDGFQTTHAIRVGNGGDIYKNIPIIALTANAFAEDRERCLRCGMNAYLSKPVDEASLVEVVLRYLESANDTSVHRHPDNTKVVIVDKAHVESDASQRILEIESQTKSIEDVLAHLSRWEREDALRRVRARVDRLHRLIAMFIEGSEERMLSLEKALRVSDYNEIQMIAHSIKGISGNLGALRLQEISSKLEVLMKNEAYDTVDKFVKVLEIENQALIALLQVELDSGYKKDGTL